MIYVNDYLDPEYVWFLDAKDKTEVLDRMIEGLSASPKINDASAFGRAVKEREAVMSTGLGLGFAVPHVKIPQVQGIALGVGIVPGGVDWDALDGAPVKLVFLFAAGADEHQLYLRLLSKIILVMKNRTRRESLILATTPQQVLELFKGV